MRHNIQIIGVGSTSVDSTTHIDSSTSRYGADLVATRNEVSVTFENREVIWANSANNSYEIDRNSETARAKYEVLKLA